MKRPRIFLCLLLALTSSATAAQRNILLLIADDYGVDSSALYNPVSPPLTQAPTPNINSLAASGVRFTNAYAYPVCSPTRACMLTGRYGFRTGIGEVVTTSVQLSASEFTLPEAFAANGGLGYQLKQFGKWHLTMGPGTNRTPSTVGGWPAYAGSLPGALPSYTSWTKVVTDGTVAGTTSTTVTTYATTDVVDDAVAWIQTQTLANRPWFAWVAFNAPHTPFHKPPNALCPTYASLSGTTADINANPRRYFEAAVEAMDTEIGRLLASVNLANTDIIFIGDNGTPGQVPQSPYVSGRVKDTLYQGGIHVPMIVSGPDVLAGGRTSDTFVHVVDLYSTILELAGISTAATIPAGVTIDSQSIVPVLANQPRTRTRLYDEHFDITQPTLGGRVLCDDRYKLIRFRDTRGDVFYDLATDPYENTNLLAGGVNSMNATDQSHYYRLRFDLGRYTTAASPLVSGSGLSEGTFSITIPQNAAAAQTLWRCTDLADGFWAPVPGATGVINGSNITFSDPAPPSASAFYSVAAETP